MTDRKKPTAGFWITVALVAVLVAYPLSFGPACWITSRTEYGMELLPSIYRPMILAWDKGPEFVGIALNWYSQLGAADGWAWWGSGKDRFWRWKTIFTSHGPAI